MKHPLPPLLITALITGITGCSAAPDSLPPPAVPELIPVTWDGTPGWFIPNDRLETLLLQLHTKNTP